MFRSVLRASLLLLAGLATGVALHTGFTPGDTVFAGKRPSNLGVKDGRLSPVKSSPNNVSSQADPSDARHHIAPLKFSGNGADAVTQLRRVVEGMERTRVIEHRQDYLYAEFRSRLMGYVDDVEFHVSEKEGVIHVRSASRLGESDFGVNRKRVEAIREHFESAAHTGAQA